MRARHSPADRPLGFFRDAVLDERGEERAELDIAADAVRPIVESRPVCWRSSRATTRSAPASGSCARSTAASSTGPWAATSTTLSTSRPAYAPGSTFTAREEGSGQGGNVTGKSDATAADRVSPASLTRVRTPPSRGRLRDRPRGAQARLASRHVLLNDSSRAHSCGVCCRSSGSGGTGSHARPPGPLHDYYAAAFPERSLDVARVDFVALDFETTALDPERAEILSLGFVPIRALNVVVADSVHRLVRPSAEVPADSAIVHGILDDRASRGEALRDALPALLRALTGHVLVAHHAGIEHRMLDRACRALYGTPFVAPVVDTLALEKRTLERGGQPIVGNALRLGALRERYRLPRYRAHDALVDAIATAELLLAPDRVPLGDAATDARRTDLLNTPLAILSNGRMRVPTR